jgi:hypothetical protein
MDIASLRKHRFFNMAIFDLVGTMIIAFIVHTILWMYPLEMKNKEKRTYFQYLTSLLLILITFFGIGVIFHRIFKIQSALSGYLGLNDMPMRSSKNNRNIL